MGQHILSEEQIQEIRQSFNAIDTNGDGRLSLHELMRAQQALGLNPTMADTKRMIDEVDANKSGYIELHEYTLLMAERYGAMDYEQEMMRAAFLHFDADKSGSLCKEELQKYLTRCGDKLSEAEFNQVIADVDVDGDGKINLEEFTSMLTKKRFESEGY